MTPKFTLHGAIQTFHWKRPYEWKPGENTLLYMPLNGDALDYSGNGNNGTASNITWDSGGDDGCASFNGSNSYIDVPSLSISDNLTISCWINTTQANDGEIIQMTNSAGTQSLEFMVYDGKLGIWLWNDGYTSTGGTSSASINTGQWINVIVTKSGTNYNLYINSLSDGTFTSSFGMGFNNNRIGLHTNGSATPYNGLIDNFIIEDKVRTEQDISNYYNRSKVNYEPKPREPNANTIAYYPLTSNANDYSGNEYNATNYEGTFSTQNGGYFGTITSRLELPSMTIGQNFTISAWIKLPNGQPTGNQELDIYYDWSGSYRNILYACVAGGIICHTGNNATYSFTKTVSTTFGTGWNNIILSKNGTSYSIYKNGVLLETFTAIHNVSIPGGNNTVYIGHTSYSTSEYSAFGYIKDYILEDKSWTSEDIANYYNQTKGDYGIS